MRLGSSFLFVLACVGCAAQPERSATPVVDVAAPVAASARADGASEDTAWRDADHDRIPDDRDLCPSEPEDQDGFTDDDGCPDLDNDGDGVADANDHCPDEAENRDGFEDEDGCPETSKTLAKRAFKEALAASDRGDFAEARRLFEEAYRILPGDVVFFHLAATALAQRDHDAACRYYKQWRASPTAQTKPRGISALDACP
ncbi:tetratricopeptide repeat protein [Polyangium sp. y55x31]|uniref:tetratricopeptide repeat protein n=1 Tax=Polyangium sp. y55x31 TaxID=3042688 RepID=UPI0024828737|nr:tetratricopeptide repeat protein [Polyangium sp. y55x31]MDI1479957.1 tetratricopeptide repeat protein [Polyangium sp. y55x31]